KTPPPAPPRSGEGRQTSPFPLPASGRGRGRGFEVASRRYAVIVEAQVTVNGAKSAIWAAITNIENAAAIISGIQKIEIVEKPANGLVGLRWRETRILFGKPATVEKWITDVADNEFYTTRAEDNGFVFFTTTRISESSGGMTLTSSHETKPQG